VSELLELLAAAANQDEGLELPFAPRGRVPVPSLPEFDDESFLPVSEPFYQERSSGGVDEVLAAIAMALASLPMREGATGPGAHAGNLARGFGRGFSIASGAGKQDEAKALKLQESAREMGRRRAEIQRERQSQRVQKLQAASLATTRAKQEMAGDKRQEAKEVRRETRRSEDESRYVEVPGYGRLLRTDPVATRYRASLGEQSFPRPASPKEQKPDKVSPLDARALVNAEKAFDDANKPAVGSMLPDKSAVVRADANRKRVAKNVVLRMIDKDRDLDDLRETEGYADSFGYLEGDQEIADRLARRAQELARRIKR
jgi:hypothetical protein